MKGGEGGTVTDRKHLLPLPAMIRDNGAGDGANNTQVCIASVFACITQCVRECV